MNRIVFLALLGGLVTASASAQFRYEPVGQLERSRGYTGSQIFARGMRFPLQQQPAYLNSQIYGVGGYMGPGGGQCDSRNYSYPWYDNFCEARTWTCPLCPTRQGHQGQDIRPATCANDRHATVATVPGRINDIGYSINLIGDDGTKFTYLHTSRQQVRAGQRVNCGDVLSYVSNLDKNGNGYTTYHLHFEIRKAIAGLGFIPVSPYTSLVDAYQRMGGGGACDGAPTPMTDMGPAPEPGCHSSTLGRVVDSGECVQVDYAGCGVARCGVYQCTSGGWSCSVSGCTTTHENASCANETPPAGSCRSYTLGREVDSGTCVQVDSATRPGEPASCADGCGWYVCDEGRWQCTTEGSCGGETIGHSSCRAPGPDDAATCRSSILGRDVESGTCVQVDGKDREGEPAACAEGCGWYRCDEGVWNCASQAECGRDQYANAACSATGQGCVSYTLGTNVSHGDCVQVDKEGCGMDSCSWYRCSDGAWTCSETSDCSGLTYENEACEASDPCTGGERTDCGSCTSAAGCAWCPGTNECMLEGTARDSCEGWRDSRSACEPCDFNDCNSCTGSGYCSWCPGVGCVNEEVEDDVARCGTMISSRDEC
ncbi:MAG: hypothetical protein CMN30_15390 [Sandaracinus sp.]|nr:hypothetical protein [Sandaracinus sp.]|tara:strand:- start:536 stop:2329 length:1794 start_codon:yes stop_codon:yes gene_type:complete